MQNQEKMVRFGNTFRTQQTIEREAVRDARTHKRNQPVFPEISVNNLFISKQRSLSPQIEIQSNNTHARFQSNLQNKPSTAVGNRVKFSGRSASCGTIPTNDNNIVHRGTDMTAYSAINSKPISKHKPAFTPHYQQHIKMEEPEPHIELFDYEESLGDERWEDELPQLFDSALARHSRLRYPSPLLRDTTRQFETRTARNSV